MDTKNYFILGLILLLAVIGITAYSQINGLKQEQSRLQEENKVFLAKVEKATEENKRLQEKIQGLSADLQSLSEQKSELEKSLHSTGAERDELKGRVAFLDEELKKKELAAAAEKETALAPAGDTQHWARVLKQKAGLELEIQRLKGALGDAQRANEELTKEKSLVQMDFSSLSNDSSEIKRELDYNTKVLDNLTEELAREKTDKYRVSEAFKLLRSENTALRQQVKNFSARKMELTQKVTQLQAKNDELQSRLGRMEALVKDRLLQLDSLKQDLGLGYTANLPEPASPAHSEPAIVTPSSINPSGGSFLPPVVPGNDMVQLQPIVVKPGRASEEERSLALPKRGNILAINDENKFVIVNVGESGGASVGDNLRVQDQQNQYKGELEVIQVRKNIAACDIKSERSPFLVGDSVY